MRQVTDFLLGTCRIRIRGPWPLQVINALRQNGIVFWNLNRSAECFEFWTYTKLEKRVLEIAEGYGCEATMIRKYGAKHAWRGLGGRWILLSCMVLNLILVIVAQNVIWDLRVEGNERLSQEQILQALESIGIHQGTWVSRIEGQSVKNQMLALIPELEWISVNKKGGIATVLVHERSMMPQVRDPKLVTNIIAGKSGVITSVQVQEGFPVTEKGKAVREGELLVSGLGSSWNSIVCRNAQAEVYAYTRYDLHLITPEVFTQRTDQTEEHVRWSLIVGKKRVNFFTNGGISLTGYDRIEEVFQLRLPGDVSFPLSLVKTVYRQYSSDTTALEEETAKQLLTLRSKAFVAGEMVAGQILHTEEALVCEEDVWQLRAVIQAHEMIARTQKINPWSNGEFE